MDPSGKPLTSKGAAHRHPEKHGKHRSLQDLKWQTFNRSKELVSPKSLKEWQAQILNPNPNLWGSDKPCSLKVYVPKLSPEKNAKLKPSTVPNL